MKNILNENAKEKLHGRTKFTMEYVEDEDIKDKKILNIGCGFGWFEYNVINREGGIEHIYGIDLTEKDIQAAKDSIEDERITFEVGSALELPFEDAVFDLVVSWDVIEHIPKHAEKQMIKEIERVLAVGGKFYISTPYKCFIGNILDPAWWLIGHRHYSKSSMKSIIEEDTQLSITDMQVRGGIWSILETLNMYVSKWIFRRKPFFSDFFEKKENNEYSVSGGIQTLFVKGGKKQAYLERCLDRETI